MSVSGQAPLVHAFGSQEHGQKGRGNDNTSDRGNFLGQQIQDRADQENQEDEAQANRYFNAADADVDGHLELARTAILEAQDHHRQGDKNKTNRTGDIRNRQPIHKNDPGQ